ncbi:phosphatase 2C-like domain-containing protein, partial [Kalaharituber pfeilii]
LQFKFHTGTSLFAKRPSRPFPPPFNPLPSPTSTSPLRDAFRSFHFNQDALGYLRGVTNGDDAVLISPYYIGVADGVGAWNTRPQGHAALWSRLILHFWAIEIEQQVLRYNSQSASDRDMRVISPLSALQASYETTTAITTSVPILGTTTACIALLLPPTTLLLTNLGDSQAFVFRPSENKFIARTEEQWHWFDCPRQLGTNSPDTPEKEGKVVEVQLEEEDVLVVATDGLMDNLWEAEVTKDLMEWIKAGEVEQNMAENLVEKAKAVAGDPWGLSPYMERAVEQGLGIEGGKWDDISVVVARCKK